MLHSKHLTIPANTSEAAPYKTQFLVNQGVIYRIWITFPGGCVGLVKLRILHQGHPILPVEKDAYITGNNYTYEYPLMEEIITSPETLSIEAWNEDDTYSHKIDIQILILAKKWVLPVGAYEGIIAALKSISERRSE